MRTSDEKRREIAEELRAESERWHYYREDDNVFCMSDHEFAEVILDDFGFNDMDMPAYEVFGQMADIIDPTCEMTPQGEGFRCSACGTYHDMSGFEEFPWPRCPECGARVVSCT